MGVSKLMDLLSDSREIIRNDVRLRLFKVISYCFIDALFLGVAPADSTVEGKHKHSENYCV